MIEANLSGATLDDADLSGVALVRVTLNGAELLWAKSPTSAYRCHIRNGCLWGADLDAGLFKRCDLAGVDLAER
jgi:uncharacterized protein YjbI with pentapeptide repeats